MVITDNTQKLSYFPTLFATSRLNAKFEANLNRCRPNLTQLAIMYLLVRFTDESAKIKQATKQSS